MNLEIGAEFFQKMSHFCCITFPLTKSSCCKFVRYSTGTGMHVKCINLYEPCILVHIYCTGKICSDLQLFIIFLSEKSGMAGGNFFLLSAPPGAFSCPPPPRVSCNFTFLCQFLDTGTSLCVRCGNFLMFLFTFYHFM